jgi:hypothetical protein
MATKPRSARALRAPDRLLSTAVLAFVASPALADTGSVYVDSQGNAAAGHDFFSNTFSGIDDVGLGYSVMPALTTGFGNVAVGWSALASDTTGSANVATGIDVLSANTTGGANTASGQGALNENTTGRANVATGSGALGINRKGHENVADGTLALGNNTRGNDNTGLGEDALDQNSTGDSNIGLGAGAGAKLTTGSNNVDIANAGKAGEAGTIRIGDADQTRAFLAGVSGASVSGPAQPVIVNAQGQLGTASAASKVASEAAVDGLRAQNRRLAARVAALEREVRGLSHR